MLQFYLARSIGASVAIMRSRHVLDQTAAPLDRALVGLHADERRLVERQHTVEQLEHPLVLGADRQVEADDLLGRHREVVVAPHDEREVRGDVVDRCRQQQQDVLEPGVVADGAAHVERQVEPRAHRPLDDAGRLAAGERAEVAVVRPHLVAVAEPPVVERLQLELRHLRVLRPPERADVHEREVGDVEEVVGHPRRRRLPHVDRRVDAAERRVVLVGDDRDAVGSVDGVPPRHTQTRPYRSAQPNVDRCARGGGGTCSAADGTRTQRPSSPNVQPWYGHTRHPSSIVPIDSGASRCGHRSGAATTAPSAGAVQHDLACPAT